MIYLIKITLLFLVCLGLTIRASFVGDDDIVYKFFERKPTGQEALIRIRYVLIKAFAIISGGCLFAAILGLFVLRPLSIKVVGNQALLLVALGMAIVGVIIGTLQNCIRRDQGRQRRPIFDMSIIRHNWRGRS